MSHDDFTPITVDLREKRLETDLLDAISRFHLVVQKMREGDNEIGPSLFENMIRLFDTADREKSDLRLSGAIAPDLFYTRVATAEVMDGFTRDFCKGILNLLFDQFRARGVISFYILDNELREDRFAALKELAALAGLHMISPSIDSNVESEIIQAIKYHMALRHHIIYVEPNASVNYLNTVKALARNSNYIAGFRNQAPSDPRLEILSLGAEHGK